jgi:hypothetical protein
MSEIRAHLDAIAFHLTAIRAAIEAPPVAVPSLPAHCIGVDACARNDESSRISLSTFTHPHAFRCVTCRDTFNMAITADTTMKG